MKFFKKTLVAAATALACGSAFALPAASTAFVTGANQLSDDSAEVVLDNNLNGLIDVGDVLVGMVGITSFPSSGVGAGTVNELSAIYAVQVTSIVPVPTIACTGVAAMATCSGYTFGAVAGGLNTALAAANAAYGLALPAFSDALGGALLASTIAVFLEDTTPDFDRTTASYAAAFATASDGTVRMTVGLGGAGDSFTTLGPANPLELLLVGQGTGVGGISIDGTIETQNFPGWVFAPQITGTGGLSPGGNDPFLIQDDTTYTVNARRLPEPGMLGLLGIGLFGLAAGSRRQKAG